MFERLGKLATRYAGIVTAVWIAGLAVSFFYVPEWSTVAENGEFAFLPPDSPSVQAERQFRKYFPDYAASSNIVLVVRRETSDQGLTEADRDFVRGVLVRRLCDIFQLDSKTGRPLEDSSLPEDSVLRLVTGIVWFGTPYTGAFYDSEDGKATLIVLTLQTEFLDQRNAEIVELVEREVARMHRVRAEKAADAGPAETETEDSLSTDVAASGTSSDQQEEDAPPERWALPQGLDISLSGTATYGRDSIREATESGKATERWTVILVVILLLGMYRAPLLALIPLMTVAVASALSLNLLAIGAKYGIVRLFNGIEPYVTVLVYGAGVDYCLFLIARYREQLDRGDSIDEAICVSLSRVGSALAASAGTTMCGIGMMAFALFGKFQQAGIAISFGLFICLGTSLTLAPAVLYLFGRWAFWPNIPVRESSGSQWATGGIWSRLMNLRLLNAGWKSVGRVLQRRPGRLWLTSILVLAPFAIVGGTFYGDLSYGLLSELPPTAASVRGANALRAHFPGGEGVPIRVLVKVPGANYAKRTRKPPADIQELTANILAHKDELGLETVRSLADPTGGRSVDVPSLFLRNKALKDFANSDYPEVTRLELILRNDAFSRTSISEFRRVRERFSELLPESMKQAGAQYWFAGETASLSDLKEVTDRDRTVVNSLVVLVVFLILWVLLRRPWICAYLLITVLFSYLATLGCTFLVFWMLDPSGFAGLDWKVPMFLFTILVAVGEDYNIFLITRIEEETREHGPIKGIVVALERTGAIISSCGIIMAGTFSSLMAGSLKGMDQLGFALALGVFLDTFVIRPIMVPAFMLILAKRRAARQVAVAQKVAVVTESVDA